MADDDYDMDGGLVPPSLIAFILLKFDVCLVLLCVISIDLPIEYELF